MNLTISIFAREFCMCAFVRFIFVYWHIFIIISRTVAGVCSIQVVSFNARSIIFVPLNLDSRFPEEIKRVLFAILPFQYPVTLTNTKRDSSSSSLSAELMVEYNHTVHMFFFFLLYFLPNMEHQDLVNLVVISHIKRITPTADWNMAPFKSNNGKVREYPDGLQRHYVTS